jgi:hypothetical protein
MTTDAQSGGLAVRCDGPPFSFLCLLKAPDGLADGDFRGEGKIADSRAELIPRERTLNFCLSDHRKGLVASFDHHQRLLPFLLGTG